MFIKINKGLFEKQSDYLIGVVVAQNIDNKIEAKEIGELLDSVVVQQREAVQDQVVKDLKEFEPYRAAMKKFGISLSRSQMSVEALLKRISKGGNLPSINPVVDLANVISLQYHIPIGVHDIDSLIGDLEIRFVKGDDVFDDPDESSGFDNEEVVYASGNSIRTRRWIWRQMPVGLISSGAKNLVFPVDGFLGNVKTILETRDALESSIKRFFGCDTKSGLICKNYTSFNISDLAAASPKDEELINMMLKDSAAPMETQKEKAPENIHADKGSEELPGLDYSESGSENPGFALIASLEKGKAIQTRSEARRLIQQGAVKLNGEKITDVNNIKAINDGDVLQIGKGKFFKIRKSNGG